MGEWVSESKESLLPLSVMLGKTIFWQIWLRISAFEKRALWRAGLTTEVKNPIALLTSKSFFASRLVPTSNVHTLSTKIGSLGKSSSYRLAYVSIISQILVLTFSKIPASSGYNNNNNNNIRSTFISVSFQYPLFTSDGRQALLKLRYLWSRAMNWSSWSSINSGKSWQISEWKILHSSHIVCNSFAKMSGLLRLASMAASVAWKRRR